MPYPRQIWLLLLPAVACVFGCEGEQIRSYVVPPIEQAAVEQQTPRGEPTHRMVGAIVRGSDRAWFFKLVGPVGRVDAIASGLLEFFDTVSIDTSTGRPDWRLPDGWTDRGPSGMRFTTLDIPGDGDPLELTVTGLGSSPDWSGLLLENINRWRNQMKLPPTGAIGLDEQTQPLKLAPEGSVAVDLRGWFSGGMTPPFAGGASPSAPPAAKPPTPPPPVNPPTAPSPLQYDLPAGWVAEPPTAFRMANLRVSEQEGAAVVTASAFPLAGRMGDTLENVNRWRRQVGLPPTDSTALEQAAAAVTIAGVEGRLVELVGPDRGILAAMATRGDRVWFFKLTGLASDIEPQRAAFEAWVTSVRFDGETPAGEATPAGAQGATN